MKGSNVLLAAACSVLLATSANAQAPRPISIEIAPLLGAPGVVKYNEPVTVTFALENYDGSSKNSIMETQKRVHISITTEEVDASGNNIDVDVPCRLTPPLYVPCKCDGNSEVLGGSSTVINFPLVS